jgi:hypothetical protein
VAVIELAMKLRRPIVLDRSMSFWFSINKSDSPPVISNARDTRKTWFAFNCFLVTQQMIAGEYSPSADKLQGIANMNRIRRDENYKKVLPDMSAELHKSWSPQSNVGRARERELKAWRRA